MLLVEFFGRFTLLVFLMAVCFYLSATIFGALFDRFSDKGLNDSNIRFIFSLLNFVVDVICTFTLVVAVIAPFLFS